MNFAYVLGILFIIGSAKETRKEWKNLISATLAISLINWRHSGFSINHDVQIPAFSDQDQEALS